MYNKQSYWVKNQPSSIMNTHPSGAYFDDSAPYSSKLYFQTGGIQDDGYLPKHCFPTGEATLTDTTAGYKLNSTTQSKLRNKKKTTGPVHNSRYKVTLCKNWIKAGTCPYFEKCQFAHGMQELQKWTNKRSRIKRHESSESLGNVRDELSELETLADRHTDTKPPVKMPNDVLDPPKARLNKILREDELLKAVIKRPFRSPEKNQCIGQLFSMSTVFPSSILHDL
mmetsp:Transcript_631/g.642  ORF Transcript_631/g.642 Transcript_631/m.642 type:complete len:225 (+) Transcript_631:147-821(+)